MDYKLTRRELKPAKKKSTKMPGLKQRIEKRLMFATHRKIVREELNRTIAEIKEMIESVETAGHPDNSEDNGYYNALNIVLKVLDSEERGK